MSRVSPFKKTISILLPFAICPLSFTLPLETRAAVIDPSRTIDWSQAGIPGGIPNRTTICATVNSAGALQTAINNCPNNQVVSIAPGTYKLTASLTINHPIVLRGAGSSTRLILNGNII